MNENDAYKFEIEQPTSWEFNGEPVWISGWFLSKQGAVFSDVRAMIDGIPYLGLWGLPIEHIERQHRGYFGLPHAGFALLIRPPLRARDLRLELLDSGGRWVEIWRCPIKVNRGPGRRPQLRPASIPEQLKKLLQERRAHPDADLLPLARQLALEAVAERVDALPNPPFYGALEYPIDHGSAQFGKLRVDGWIIHKTQRIRRLLASTHPLVENEMDYGERERADVASFLPDHPDAATPQFLGMVDIDEGSADPACLKIFAELEDSTIHLVFARRFHLRASNREERRYPEFSQRTFWSTVALFIRACRREGLRLGPWGEFRRRCVEALQRFRQFAPITLAHRQRPAPTAYDAWVRTNRLTLKLHEHLAGELTAAGDRLPVFTVLVDARGVPAGQLQELADSLEIQLHSGWEAWFVGSDSAPAGDRRLHREPMRDPADFVRALNAAAHQSSGTHLLLVPGSSRLPADALSELALRFATNPSAQLVYTDEDRMDDSGGRSAPEFKPDWSPTLALSDLFPGQLSAIRRETFLQVGSFRPDFPDVSWFDLLLRIGDELSAAEVSHIAHVCHHARASVPIETDPSAPAVEQARRTLTDALQRRAWPAEAFLPEIGHHLRRRFHQLYWHREVLQRLPVTIVIPTRDRLHLLQECVELLDETVDWRYVKLVIVDDHSRDADAVRYLKAIEQRPDLMCKVVRPEDRAAPFNYSHLVNLALPHVDTPLILHLNNDVNALKLGWLEEMVGWFTQPDIAVVGAQLLYPDKALNHTGIVIGPHGGLADTPLTRVRPEEAPLAWHAAAREVSAVTGACLMTRTSVYRDLGGFDERDFGVSYNDVDYCLRVRQAGHRIVYTPQAKLMHWGSATRGVTFDDAEHVAFLQRYPAWRDPYLNPNLRLEGALPACVGSRHTRAERAGRVRLLLITHNLNLEGAPLFLLEYARWMVREAGFSINVLSAQEGPLREAYRELGAEITLVDPHRLSSSPDETTFHHRLADVSRDINWHEVDLVVCNTLVCYWGVHLAHSAGKPSLFYIHESTSLSRFFDKALPLQLHVLVEQAFARCTYALFLCQATRAYYEDYNVRDNYRIVPSWIRVSDIDSFRAQHPRAQTRRDLGYADDEIVIANIGTVCERKGQHIFIRAVDHFRHHFGHRAKFRFVMVGARPGIYLDLLKREMTRLDLNQIELVPETRDVFRYFVAADLFVCTSYEESFPRVVMEAMAFRTPIVSTDVHGIPELVKQRGDAYLVPPGDPVAFSRMMWTCLAKERSGKTLTATAYSTVMRYHSSRHVLPVHRDLAREAMLEGSDD